MSRGNPAGDSLYPRRPPARYGRLRYPTTACSLRYLRSEITSPNSGVGFSSTAGPPAQRRNLTQSHSSRCIVSLSSNRFVVPRRAAVSVLPHLCYPVVNAMTLAAARLAELSDLPPPAGVGVAACQNIEISKKGYAAFDAGDVEMILNYYDDNVEFVVPGNSAVSGTYRGKGGVKELFGKVAERADPHHLSGQPAAVSRAVRAHRAGQRAGQWTSRPAGSWPDDAAAHKHPRTRSRQTHRIRTGSQPRNPRGSRKRLRRRLFPFATATARGRRPAAVLTADLRRGNGEEMPFAGHTRELVTPALLELEP
jgi:hypothetical protein